MNDRGLRLRCPEIEEGRVQSSAALAERYDEGSEVRILPVSTSGGYQMLRTVGKASPL